MISLKQALVDPSSVFLRPNDVIFNHDLTRSQKIEILKHWESDMREIQVAEDENMLGENSLDILDEVLNAMHVLDANIDVEHTPPTKQGG